MITAPILLSLIQFNPTLPIMVPVVSPASAQVSTDTLPRRGALGAAFAPLPADQAAKYNLQPGQGLVAKQPISGLTAHKAGIQADDVILKLNGKPAMAAGLGAMVRELPAGKSITFEVSRNGKTLTLSTNLVEKPRDPGNRNYEVIYSSIESHGKKMRTIITKPKAPGKHPGFFFIQGFSPISYDFTLEGSMGDVSSIDGPLLYEFANTGYVTMRVEKPGVGDSEGGPFAEMDYLTEIDIYRKALLQLKAVDSVDNDNVFIFGHSMGGAFGPMIATEIPVKGIAVYGTASRTWFEYLLDTLRYQGLVAGASYAQADESVRRGAVIMGSIFLENKTPEQVKAAHPNLAAEVDGYFPGGKFNGKTSDFWRQLNQINFADYWAKCNAHVLAVRGASDFVTYDVDHKLIADIVNRARPGYGTFAIAPSSDHLFHDFATEPESMKNFQNGKFNMAFTHMMAKWMKEIRSK